MSDDPFLDGNDYILPVGQRWKYIGDCSCRGQDSDCVNDDSQWEVEFLDEA